MGDQNSLVGIYASVAGQMIYDLYVLLHSADPYFMPVDQLDKKRDQDLRKLSQRVAAEGLPFLTVALPGLGKALDRVLADGCSMTQAFMQLGDPPGFALETRGWLRGHPRFLGPIWVYLFDKAACEACGADIGEVLSREETAPYLELVRALRTFCYLFYKLETDYTLEQKLAKLTSFVMIELGLPETQSPYPQTTTGQWICEEAESILEEVLDGKFPFQSNLSHLDMDQAQ